MALCSLSVFSFANSTLWVETSPVRDVMASPEWWRQGHRDDYRMETPELTHQSRHRHKKCRYASLWVQELYLNSDLSFKKQNKNEYINYTPDKYFTIMFTLIFFFFFKLRFWNVQSVTACVSMCTRISSRGVLLGRIGRRAPVKVTPH